MKKLSELEKEQMSNPQLKTSSLLPDVCHDPALPVDLQPVCASQEAASIFKALSKHTAHRSPSPAVFLPLCVHPTPPRRHQLFLLSNPVAMDRKFGGPRPLPSLELPQSHSPEKFFKDLTSAGRDSGKTPTGFRELQPSDPSGGIRLRMTPLGR